MSRPNVGDRFPFMMEAEPSNIVHCLHTDLNSTDRTYIFGDWAKIAEAGPLPVGGEYRIKTTIRKYQDFTGHSYARVYKNGEPYGDVLESNSDWDVPKSLTQNLEFSAGDNIELWGYSDEGWIGKLDEFLVMSTLGIPTWWYKD